MSSQMQYILGKGIKRNMKHEMRFNIANLPVSTLALRTRHRPAAVPAIYAY